LDGRWKTSWEARMIGLKDPGGINLRLAAEVLISNRRPLLAERSGGQGAHPYAKACHHSTGVSARTRARTTTA